MIKLKYPKIWKNIFLYKKLKKEIKNLSKLIYNIKNHTFDFKETINLINLDLKYKNKQIKNHISEEIKKFNIIIRNLEFYKIFNKKTDKKNALLEIKSGSGGIEAQDWSKTLMRMYILWGEKHKYKINLLNISNGDIKGIKNCKIMFKGKYAYGWLRTETGIHRLVRKSPFNTNKKRHTSFSSIFITPEIIDSKKRDSSKLNFKDLRIDRYRSSGAGGQHVNRTESAIRITHKPTGIVVQSQNERSQHKNKKNAIKQLTEKISEEKQKLCSNNKKYIENSKNDISWGNQIRSYILDQSIIKDLRTGLINKNPQYILNGKIDFFIKETLKKEL